MNNDLFKIKSLSSLSDFKFPIACNDLCISKNGKKLLAVGIYKPTVKLFDLKTLTLKYERNIICDPLKICLLDDDAEKYCILRNDKTLEFHLNSGSYETIKLPYHGKDVLYNEVSSELYISANCEEIFRFNLEQGRFLKNIQSSSCDFMKLSKINGILGVGYDNQIRFFDSRVKEEIFCKEFDTRQLIGFDFDDTGTKYCISDDWSIWEYDFRSENFIRQIVINNCSKLVYAKKNLIASRGKLLCFITHDDRIEYKNLGFNINTFDVHNGVVFVGGENEQIKGYCSSVLGDCPSWFIDAITE